MLFISGTSSIEASMKYKHFLLLKLLRDYMKINKTTRK